MSSGYCADDPKTGWQVRAEKAEAENARLREALAEVLHEGHGYESELAARDKARALLGRLSDTNERG